MNPDPSFDAAEAHLTPNVPALARRPGRALATAGAAALVLGGGLFAVGQISSSSAAEGGANTPEAAVEAMLSSLEQNDLIGVLDHLAPGERDVLRDATIDYVAELKRLGVLSSDLDPENIAGFDVDFEAMTYEVEQANPRVWLVEVTGGQVALGVDAAELPYGELFTDMIGEIPEDEATETFTVDIAEELDPDDPPVRVAVIAENGEYYVSSFYTAAETLAAVGGYELPDTPIPAVGAASPEQAVVEMFNASVALDLERVIELTPPDEMAALHDYGPILVDLAEQGITESGVREEMEGWTISLDEFETETVAVTGGTKVLPVHVAVSVESADGESGRFSATKVDETCVEFAYRFTSRDEGQDAVEEDSGRYCADDIYDILADSEVPKDVQEIAVRMAGQVGQLGVVTVQVDGAWYVSPVRSSTDVLLVAFQGLRDGDLQTLADWFLSGAWLDVEGLDVDGLDESEPADSGTAVSGPAVSVPADSVPSDSVPAD